MNTLEEICIILKCYKEKILNFLLAIVFCILLFFLFIHCISKASGQTMNLRDSISKNKEAIIDIARFDLTIKIPAGDNFDWYDSNQASENSAFFTDKNFRFPSLSFTFENKFQITSASLEDRGMEFAYFGDPKPSYIFFYLKGGKEKKRDMSKQEIEFFDTYIFSFFKEARIQAQKAKNPQLK